MRVLLLAALVACAHDEGSSQKREPPAPAVAPIVDVACTALPLGATLWRIPTETPDMTKLADALLRFEVERMCTAYGYIWTPALRGCFAHATTEQAIAACKRMLKWDDRRDLEVAVEDVRERIARVAAIPKATCADAVLAHYGPTAWLPYLPKLRATTRGRMLVAARAAFEKACVDEAWSPAMRACFVEAAARRDPELAPTDTTEHDGRRGQCLAVMDAPQWTYPPASVMPAIGGCARVAHVTANKLTEGLYEGVYEKDERWVHADVVARMSMALLSACESRGWSERRRHCLLAAADRKATYACLALAPDDPLVGEIYEPRADGEESLPDE